MKCYLLLQSRPSLQKCEEGYDFLSDTLESKKIVFHDLKFKNGMTHVMRKPVFAICEQQRRRSACASAQFEQHICCSLPRQYMYNTPSFYIRNLKPLPSFCDCEDRFASSLVTNPEDRFARDEARMFY